MTDFSELANVASSIASYYSNIDTKQLSQIAIFANKLNTFYKQSGVMELHRKVNSIMSSSGYIELQKRAWYLSKELNSYISPMIRHSVLNLRKEFINNMSLHKDSIVTLVSNDLSTPNDFALSDEMKPDRQIEFAFQDYQLISTVDDYSHIIPVTDGKWFTVSLIQKIEQDDFIAGETSASEKYIETIASEYGWSDTMKWLNNIYLDYFDNPKIIIALMHCLSHFRYEDVKPEGQTMALGVLQHSDIYVKDYAVRAFENWNDKEAIPILKSLSCDAKWLQDYIDEVINALEENKEIEL